jgi:hypothetical protein
MADEPKSLSISFSFPLYFIGKRWKPRPADPLTAPIEGSVPTGYATVGGDGHECVAIFRSGTLAADWVEYGDRVESMLIGIIDSREQFIGILNDWARNGENWLGFDPGPDTKPAHLVPLQMVLKSMLDAKDGPRDAYKRN